MGYRGLSERYLQRNLAYWLSSRDSHNLSVRLYFDSSFSRRDEGDKRSGKEVDRDGGVWGGGEGGHN